MYVEIRAVEPETEYEGTVYDQSVRAVLPTGQDIGLFDPDLLVNLDDVGRKMNVTISTLTGPSDIITSPKKRKGVEPSTEKPASWNNHTYYGEVVEIRAIHNDSYEVCLDVGAGQIIVWPEKEEFPDLSVGDFLQVTAIRSDVYDIGDC